MQTVSSRGSLGALASLLVAIPARAQLEADPLSAAAELDASPSAASELGEVLRTGIVPLFTAMGAGILFMATLVVIAVIWMRPRMPRLPRIPQEV